MFRAWGFNGLRIFWLGVRWFQGGGKREERRGMRDQGLGLGFKVWAWA